MSIVSEGEEEDNIVLTGKVTSGKKRGRFFLSKKRYREQFIDLLDIDPKEGTLNIELDERDLERFRYLREKEGVKIEGFEEDGEKFGDVEAYDAKIDDIRCAVVVPKKSDYDKTVEMVSDHKLRDELGLKDGDEITVEVSF